MLMNSSPPFQVPEQTKYALIFKIIYYMRKNKIISDEEKNKLKDYVIEKQNKKIDALFNEIEVDHKSIQEELLDILQDLNDSILHEESYEFPPLNQIIKSNRKLQNQTSLDIQFNNQYQQNSMLNSLDRQSQQPNQYISKFTFPTENSENLIQNFQNPNMNNTNNTNNMNSSNKYHKNNNFPSMQKGNNNPSIELFMMEEQPTNTHFQQNHNLNFMYSNSNNYYEKVKGSTKMHLSSNSNKKTPLNYDDDEDKESQDNMSKSDVKSQVSQLQQRNKLINRNARHQRLSIHLNPDNNNVIKSRTYSQIPIHN